MLIEYDINSQEILYDDNLRKMKQNILLFHFKKPVDKSNCDCNSAQQTVFQIFEMQTYCWEYCRFEESQRLQSNYKYDMEISDIDKWEKEHLYLINGLYKPDIDDLQVGIFRRLRIINGLGAMFIQFNFPITDCDWYLLAIDGIFLDSGHRDLSLSPYDGEYILPSGGRADIAVKCHNEGIYTIKTSEDNHGDNSLNTLNRAKEDTTLFTITVYNETIDENDTISDLPLSYPPKPDYLIDMVNNNGIISDNDIIRECECNTFKTGIFDAKNSATECRFWFGNDITKLSLDINGVQYNPYLPLSYIKYDNYYEFEISTHVTSITGVHIFHHHVNPFQVTDDIGPNGFLAQKGDRFDTFGAPEIFYIRVYTADFIGKNVIHCHILDHEDFGMMGYYEIKPENQVNDTIRDECRDKRGVTGPDVIIIVVISIASCCGLMCLSGGIIVCVERRRRKNQQTKTETEMSEYTTK